MLLLYFQMTLLPWSQLFRGAWAVRVFVCLPSQVSSRWSLYSSFCSSTEPDIRRLYGRWSVRTQQTLMPVLVTGSENGFSMKNFYTNWSFGAGVQVAEWRVCICVRESDVTRERCFWRTFSLFFKEYLPFYNSVPPWALFILLLYVLIFPENSSQIYLPMWFRTNLKVERSCFVTISCRTGIVITRENNRLDIVFDRDLFEPKITGFLLKLTLTLHLIKNWCSCI